MRYGSYLHGGPRGERKVVLSSELLDSGELSDVDVVAGSIGKRFLDRVCEFGDLACKEDGKLLLLIFCHGDDAGAFDLGRGAGPLTYAKLRGCIATRTRTAIVTTACYSGSWVVDPDVHCTAMEAASAGAGSISWEATRSMARACGSVFASALIKSLSICSDDPSTVTESAEEQTWGQANNPCPPSATEAQTAAFNEFCRAVNSLCGSLVVSEHAFSFAAQGNARDMAWTDRIGIPYRHFEERWNSLKTHVPVQEAQDSSLPDAALGIHVGNAASPSSALSAPHVADGLEIDKARLRSCIAYFLTTSPGSWRGSGQQSLRWFLTDCHERGSPEDIYDPEEIEQGCVPPVEEQRNALCIIQYRMQFAKAVDFIVALMGLPLPNDEKALFYDHPKWRTKNLSGETEEETYRVCQEYLEFPAQSRFVRPRFLSRGLRQGPPFHVMSQYMCASLYEYHQSTGSMKQVDEKIDEFFGHFDDMKDCMLQLVKSDNVVNKSRKRWLESIGT